MQPQLVVARKVTNLLIFMILSALLASCVPVEQQQAKYKWKAITNLSNAGNIDAAIAEGHKLLNENPNDPGTLYWLADAYKDKGQTEEAEKLYLKIANKDEFDPDFFAGAHINLGWMYMSDTEKALPHFELALKVRPMLLDALVPRNKIYLYQGRYSEALTGFEHLLSNPGITNQNILNFNQKYEGYRGKAFALLGLGAVEAALATLDKAEADKIYSTEWDRALIYYATGNEAKLQRLYANRGVLNVEIKDYVGAEGHNGAEIVAVTAGGPADRAGLLVGDILLQIGDKSFDNGAEFVDLVGSFSAGQTVQIDLLRNGQPLMLKATLAPGYLDVVVNWAAQQNIIAPILAQREAVTRIDKEIANGNLRQALQLCLDHLWVTSTDSEQRPIMEKAIAIVQRLDPAPAIPEEAVRHAARAEAFLKAASSYDETSKAFEEFEAALRLAPWWADAWFNLGIAQKGSGDPAAAIDSLKMFMLAAPDDPATPQVQREVYGLEVEVERATSQGEWQGRWTDFSSIYELRLDGNQASLLHQTIDQGDRDNGFSDGDVRFSGIIEGNRLRGKKVFHGIDSDVARCFGTTYDKDITVEMGDNGYTLTAHWQSSNFKIQSCQVTGLEDQSMTYWRLP